MPRAGTLAYRSRNTSISCGPSTFPAKRSPRRSKVLRMRRMSQTSVPMPEIIATLSCAPGARLVPAAWCLRAQMQSDVGALDAALVVPHRLGITELERIRDQRVADRHLRHARHLAQEARQVLAVQVVARVDAQALRQRRARRGGET